MDDRVSQLIDLALEEDIGPGDVTSEFFVPADREGRAFLVAKSVGVVAGVEIGAEVFSRVDAGIEVNMMLQDGSAIAPGAYVMEAAGKARSLLTAERTVINFVQRLSGVATKTALFVEAVKGTGATIIDTRKTTPGWRSLEKAAVVAGGGQNHRMGLYDRAMVKDNHLVVEGGVEELRESALLLKEAHPGVGIEVEAETLEQVEAEVAKMAEWAAEEWKAEQAWQAEQDRLDREEIALGVREPAADTELEAWEIWEAMAEAAGY